MSEVWKLIDKFHAFNIESIPYTKHVTANYSASVASRLAPLDDLPINGFFVQLFFGPSILDNITSKTIFNDNEHIIQFITNESTFKDAVIDDEEHLKTMQSC